VIGRAGPFRRASESERPTRPASLLRRHLAPALAVVAVSVAARGAWVTIVHAHPVSDYLFYYESAVSLATGHGYSILGHPTAFFPVGYPAFLTGLFAALGPSLRVVSVSGVVLWTLAALFAYLLGVELRGRVTGVIAGLLVALAPDFLTGPAPPTSALDRAQATPPLVEPSTPGEEAPVEERGAA